MCLYLIYNKNLPLDLKLFIYIRVILFIHIVENEGRVPLTIYLPDGSPISIKADDFNTVDEIIKKLLNVFKVVVCIYISLSIYMYLYMYLFMFMLMFLCICIVF